MWRRFRSEPDCGPLKDAYNRTITAELAELAEMKILLGVFGGLGG
jgi:hypothetical protein